MKKIHKSKFGFSLLEVIIVVAIIVILASVITISAGTFISNSKAKSASADEARSSALVNIQSSEARMVELGFDRVSGSAT
jgi:type IV pilus assembly protein PilA